MKVTSDDIKQGEKQDLTDCLDPRTAGSCIWALNVKSSA